jgi:hypothetical protein
MSLVQWKESWMCNINNIPFYWFLWASS